jgi:hypothetical protein
MKQSQLSGLVLSLAFFAFAAQAGAQAPADTPPLDPTPTPVEPPPPVVEPSPPAAVAPPPPAELKWYEPVAAPLKIETPTSSVKLGLLLQPQFESLGSATLDGMSNNLFIRRTRILVGATLFKDLDFFFETDFPNLFKQQATPEGLKNTPGLNVQDAFFTYKFIGDQLKLDVGYMLTPMSHNALQSAASLYGWDYFANTFRHSNLLGSSAEPAGRDLGLELRGLLADGLLEYRVGAFQGVREPATMTDVGAQNMFRLIARLQVNLFDPETGFFYGGTYLGGKKVLSFGASYDFQDDYKYFAVDGLLDMPLGPGVITAQVNVAQWDGGDFIAGLPKQLAIMGEAGYTIAGLKLAPIVRFEKRDISDGDAGDETRIAGGLAYWAHGHNFNLKAFFSRVTPEPGDAFNAFNLQAQVYVF